MVISTGTKKAFDKIQYLIMIETQDTLEWKKAS